MKTASSPNVSCYEGWLMTGVVGFEIIKLGKREHLVFLIWMAVLHLKKKRIWIFFVYIYIYMIYTWSLGHHFCGLAVSHYTAYSCSLFLCLSQSLAVSPCISVILCLFLSSYYSMSSCFCVFLISPSASSCLFVLSVILCLPICLFLCLSDSVFFSLLMTTNYCSGMVDQRKNF